MLQLEAPRDLLQITDGTPRPEQAVEIVTLGCFTNGTIAQVVTNSLSPLSGQHLYDGSGATV